MEILQVGKYYYPPVIGGIERHIHVLAEELSKYVPVKVLACNNTFQTEISQTNNLKIVKVASPGEFFSMPLGLGIPRWLKKLDSDIIHFHLPYPTADISYFLARPRGKIVVTWHSDIIRQRIILPFYRPFLKKFLQESEVIIVSSPAMRDNSPFLEGFRDKCRIIPFGIDLERFRLTPRVKERAREIRKKYGSRIILFIGRLVPYKGLKYLIEAMEKIEGRLLIIGRGRLKRSLSGLVKQRGVGKKVSFLEPVKEEELPAYYYACDIFALPSVFTNEAFGIVQLEAMACGKPVVSTSIPTGVSFVNEDKKTGFVVSPQDPKALAGALNTLLDNQELRQQYGEYARERVIREFSKEVMAKRIMEVYKGLI
jgi:rhamnosyl/mannosyltransferase